MFKFLSKLFGTQSPAPVVEVKLEDKVVTTSEPVVAESVTTAPLEAAAAPAENTAWPFPTNTRPADATKGEWPFPKSDVVKSKPTKTPKPKAQKTQKPKGEGSSTKTARKKNKK